MVNDEAAHLLRVPQTSTGMRVADLDPNGRLADTSDCADALADRTMSLTDGWSLSSDRPCPASRHISWVATLRDRTEMLELQRELDLIRSTTDTLRAQAHEFGKRMHVVAASSI